MDLARRRATFQLKYNMFVQDIFTEVDYLNDLGKLFPGDTETIHGLPGLDSISQLPHSSHDIEHEHLFEVGHSEQNTIEQVFPGEEMVEDEFLLQSERMAHRVSDCIEEICLDTKTFDPKRFASLVEVFFGQQSNTDRMSFESECSVKTKTISRLMSKLFVTLSLSKKQMDVLNRLVKAVLIFVDPHNCSLA